MRRTADLDGPDFYPTPRWATFALIVSERFECEIWECACGDGAMSAGEVLVKEGSADAGNGNGNFGGRSHHTYGGCTGDYA